MRALPGKTGAGKESRTPDLNLGKVALYQLSYSRVDEVGIITDSANSSKTWRATRGSEGVDRPDRRSLPRSRHRVSASGISR